MAEPNAQAAVYLHPTVCVECQRRKQKCNREWPCNQCQRRKVADKCHFPQPMTQPSPPDAEPTRPDPDATTTDPAGSGSAGPVVAVVADEESAQLQSDLLDLGGTVFMAAPMLARYGIRVETRKIPAQEQDYVLPESCLQLQHALDILPKRTQMDALVQSFFSIVNFHYYIIYPPTFLAEYQAWWETRAQGKPLSLQWTSLLIIICACATQHLDVQTKSAVEEGLGGLAEDISQQYFDSCRELASVIPFGRYHLINVQRMLHAIYWFKAEAKFAEAWEIIHAAVREAQELELHKEAASEPLPELEREMRRRAWCILDSWDWQFASGLGRPTIIDHRDVDVKLPTLTLEQFKPSPLLHMKLQSELIRDLAIRFAVPKNITAPGDIQEYKAMIEDWIGTFPAVYNVDKPDTSQDETHRWIMFHRYYIHTMAYLMILNPMRPYMSKTYNADSPPEEVQIRADAVDYSLKNLECTTAWAHRVSHRDARFHFIIFSLFDTAAVLSTAIIKDVEQTIPRRGEILTAISHALSLLKRLTAISITAKTSYDILARVARRVPRPKARKKARRAEPTPPSEPSQPSQPSPQPSPQPNPPTPSDLLEIINPGDPSTPPGSLPSQAADSTPALAPEPLSTGTDSAPPSINDGQAAVPDGATGWEGVVDPAVFADMQWGMGNGGVIDDAVLGSFSVLWDWPSLDLGFIQSGVATSGNE